MNTSLVTCLFLSSIGLPEWIFITLLVLLLFGGKKIPELMRGLGRGVKEFNNAREGIKDEFQKGMTDESPGKKSE